MCMSVHKWIQVPAEALAWNQSYRELWVTWHSFWESNSGPLKMKYMLLTIELFFFQPDICDIYHSFIYSISWKRPRLRKQKAHNPWENRLGSKISRVVKSSPSLHRFARRKMAPRTIAEFKAWAGCFSQDDPNKHSSAEVLSNRDPPTLGISLIRALCLPRKNQLLGVSAVHTARISS